MASRNFYRCMAWAMAAAIAGCQSSGDNAPPPSSADRSPFSSASTYNRNNNPSEMGLTLVNGSQNKSASSSSSVSSLPPPCPGVPAAPPGNVYPPPAPPYGFAGANAVPGGPVPGQSAQSPSGYWLYQPANGFGVTKVVPIYGPPNNLPPVVGPPMGAGPVQTGPAQAGVYPGNAAPGYPPVAPNYAPVTPPYAGGAPLPQYPAPQAAYPPSYVNPGSIYPQPAAAPPFVPGGVVAGPPQANGASGTFYPGVSAAAGATAPPPYGNSQYPPAQNFAPQASAPAATTR